MVSLMGKYDLKMSIEKTRIENFITLRKTRTLGEISEKTGIDPTYLTRMQNGYRAFSEKKAREIEEGLKLPKLWMDIDRSSIHTNPTLADLYTDLDQVDPKNYEAVKVLLGGG